MLHCAVTRSIVTPAYSILPKRSLYEIVSLLCSLLIHFSRIFKIATRTGADNNLNEHVNYFGIMVVGMQAAFLMVTTDKGAVAKALRKADLGLRDMVTATLQPNLSPNQRLSLETCITVHMHQKVRFSPRSTRFCSAAHCLISLIYPTPVPAVGST